MTLDFNLPGVLAPKRSGIPGFRSWFTFHISMNSCSEIRSYGHPKKFKMLRSVAILQNSQFRNTKLSLS